MPNILQMTTSQQKTKKLIELFQETELREIFNNYVLTFANNSLFADTETILNFFGRYSLKEYVYRDSETTAGEMFVNDLSNYWTIHRDAYYKILSAIDIQYNPIENYKMTETGEDSETVNITDNTTTDSETNTITDSETSTSSNSELSVSAFDVNTFSNREKTTGSGTGTGSATSASDNTTTETSTKNAETVKNHTFSRSGNIGVTTSQQMLESEYALRFKRNLVEVFLLEFLRSYCI